MGRISGMKTCQSGRLAHGRRHDMREMTSSCTAADGTKIRDHWAAPTRTCGDEARRSLGLGARDMRPCARPRAAHRASEAARMRTLSKPGEGMIVCDRNGIMFEAYGQRADASWVCHMVKVGQIIASKTCPNRREDGAALPIEDNPVSAVANRSTTQRR